MIMRVRDLHLFLGIFPKIQKKKKETYFYYDFYQYSNKFEVESSNYVFMASEELMTRTLFLSLSLCLWDSKESYQFV